MTGTKSILKDFKSFIVTAWYKRSNIPILNIPLPWRLPYGGNCMLYPDEMGLSLLLSSIMNRKSYEEDSWRFLKTFIKPDMTCIDIGANQGFYTVLFSKMVGNDGKVFAFEPATAEFKKLLRNLKMNRCFNVSVKRSAVGSVNGVIDFIVCLDGRSSRSSIMPASAEVKARTKVEKVEITTLDSFVLHNNIEDIDLIKIDTEGSERDVLAGAASTIARFRPFIMIEMADVATRQFGYLASENYNKLISYGYALFEFTASGVLKLAREQLFFNANLLAAPKEKTERIGFDKEPI